MNPDPNSLLFLSYLGQGYTPEQAAQMIRSGQQNNLGMGLQLNNPSVGGDMFGNVNTEPIDINPMVNERYGPISSTAPQNPYPAYQEYQTYSPTNDINGEGSAQGTRRMQDFSTKKEYVDYMNQQGYDPTGAAQNWDEAFMNNGTQAGNQNFTGFPLVFPGGSDISTELYSLGRAIGAPKGSTGRIASGVAAGGAALFDITRNIASGIGYENRNRYVNDYYRQQQYGPNSRRYTAAPQYQNVNTYGGLEFRDGGLFEDGGEMQQEMQAQQASVDQVAMLQQMSAQIVQALQEGTSPQMIIQSLVQQGMEGAQAQQMVATIVQQVQSTAETDSDTAMPTMKKGGTFKHKVGDHISFTINGKKKEGKIKKIEKGKIYL